MGKVQSAKDIYRTIAIVNKKKESMAIAIDDDSLPSQIRQRRIAEHLLEKLKEPKSWKFYLKCAYRLSENKIWELVEAANKPGVHDPNRYFVFLANMEMGK